MTTTTTTPTRDEFWRLFSRVLGRPVEPGRHAVADLPQWDSLRHVELIFEIEDRFGISIPQSAIADLHSDTDRVIEAIETGIAARR